MIYYYVAFFLTDQLVCENLVKSSQSNSQGFQNLVFTRRGQEK